MISDSCAIWVYGSQVRGDADKYSDVDVLCVSEKGYLPEPLWVFPDTPIKKLSISHYSWNEIQGMAAYGSVFLHHLRLEGRPLYEGKFFEGKLRVLFNSLGAYQRAPNDLDAFRITVNDVQESISQGGAPSYELSVLGSVLRHAAILGCFIEGNPCFGRIKPVDEIVRLWGLDSGIAMEFRVLYKFRLYSARSGKILGNGSQTQVNLWCNKKNQGLVMNFVGRFFFIF